MRIKPITGSKEVLCLANYRLNANDEEITFCPKCRKDVTFTVTEALDSTCHNSLLNVDYEFMRYSCHCNECQELIYVEKYHDINVERVREALLQKQAEMERSI